MPDFNATQSPSNSYSNSYSNSSENTGESGFGATGYEIVIAIGALAVLMVLAGYWLSRNTKTEEEVISTSATTQTSIPLRDSKKGKEKDVEKQALLEGSGAADTYGITNNSSINTGTEDQQTSSNCCGLIRLG